MKNDSEGICQLKWRKYGMRSQVGKGPKDGQPYAVDALTT